MTAAAAPIIAIPSFDTLKMDDRKRSLVPDVDDGAHKAKRRKDENGNLMRMDDINEKNIESFQKDAILRQMNEYKRLKKHYEASFNELSQKQRDHDDHLRAIDAWFSQLLDEVRLIAADAIPAPAATQLGGEMFRSALEFKNNKMFSTHLQARSEYVKRAIGEIFSRIPDASPEVRSLQSQLASVLASEKAAIAECQRVSSEMEQLTQRLETASIRYMKAEKAVERAKSAQIQKLERQAMTGGTGEASTLSKSATPKRDHSEANGDLENGVASEEAEAARKEASALAESRKKQLDEMEVENERLTTALSAARTRLLTLSDDDYADTALFKTFRLQHEEVIKRVNDLEATNVQLREEAQKLQAERTSYRMQIDEEDRNNTIETESQIARCEVDLARIRHSRDELTTELAIRKSGEEDRRASSEQARELAVAHELRIKSLEAECDRLKLQLQDSPSTNGEAEGEVLGNDSLKAKLRTLSSQYSMLSQEVPSLEAAYKKTQTLASKKYTELLHSEELVGRLNAEKTKAEQKYFGAMKAKEARDQELRILKSQNTRSGEIISALKDTDGKSRELVAGLERQVAEAKEGMTKLEVQYRSVEQKHKEATTLKEGLIKQVEDLKKLVEAKDQDSLAAGKARREAEEALEVANLKVEQSKAALETFRKASVKSSGGESEEIWRTALICPICNKEMRNMALKTCGHTLCDGCVAGLVANRNRKCPSCGKAFGNNDSMRIVLA